MFKRDVNKIDNLLLKVLHDMHLDTPLREKRLIDAWEEVAGAVVARYTGNKYIRNQMLCVEIKNPALKANLMMMRSRLVEKLNATVGGRIITDIKFF